MFNIRIAGDHIHTIERFSCSGMYEIRIRAGNTLIAKHRFDTGRAARAAYRLSADTFISRFN